MASPTTEIGLPTRMVLGSLSGMAAATVCHPLDVLRVQLQVDSEGGAVRQYKGAVDAARQIVRYNGVSGLYGGLSAAYLRQWTYGSCRMGLYSYLLNEYRSKHAGDSPPLNGKLLLAGGAGAIGAFFATPAELSLVRMSADNKQPIEKRRGYSNVFNCITRIAKEEGLLAIYRGAGTTLLRAFVISAFLTGGTSQAKEMIGNANTGMAEEGIPLVMVSATIASFFANTAAMPFDVVKSRLQNMQIPKTGPPMYSGMVDCVRKSIKSEGVMVLWRGFTPAFIKLTPYTVISLVLLNTLTEMLTGHSAL